MEEKEQEKEQQQDVEEKFKEGSLYMYVMENIEEKEQENQVEVDEGWKEEVKDELGGGGPIRSGE